MDDRPEPLLQALDMVPDAVAWVGADERYRQVNAAYADRMGVPRAQILGRTMAEVLGTSYEVARPRVAAVLAGHAQTFQVIGPEARGSARYSVTYRPQLGPRGEVIGFFSVLTEVTPVADSSAARMELEQSFTQLFQYIQQGFALCEIVRDTAGTPTDFRYLAVNPAYAAMTGIPAERWIGNTLRSVLPEADPFWLETFAQVVVEGRPIQLERQSQEVGKTFEIFAYPAGGARFALLTRDVTERNAREVAMRQGQRLESLGVLAGGIAHDFNNILAAVLGNLNLAQVRVPEDAPVQQQFETMEKGLLRARDLVRQLLTYSGRSRSERRPLDLGAVVRSIAELIRVSVSRRVELSLDIEPGLRAVLADEAQVQQVVLNLVTNASEAIGDRAGRVLVRLTSETLGEARIASELPGQPIAPGPTVRFTVEDDGVGMSAAQLARIFDPYYSTKAAGRGLGLSAIRGILSAHRAGLAVHSVEGEGSRFDVWFPTLPDVAVTAAPRPVASLTAGGVLLFVDDERLLHATVPALLRTLGFEVDAVFSGEEAITRVTATPRRYRAVILDLTMPGLGGAETLPRLKAIRPDLPVLLSSGDRGRVSEAGLPAGVPFLGKPFTLEALRAALGVLLG